MSKSSTVMIVCPFCKGRTKYVYYQNPMGAEVKDCKTCNKLGRVWEVTTVTLEKIEDIKPLMKEYKGM